MKKLFFRRINQFGLEWMAQPGICFNPEIPENFAAAKDEPEMVPYAFFPRWKQQ